MHVCGSQSAIRCDDCVDMCVNGTLSYSHIVVIVVVVGDHAGLKNRSPTNKLKLSVMLCSGVHPDEG